jgi:Fur family peroxide stress response transcriptional regulator
MAIFEALVILNNHPTTDQVLDFIRNNHPHISPATVYKVLDVLLDKKLVKTVKTDKDVKRYDAIMESHHHLYYADSDKIVDYIDEDLNELLRTYFEKKIIPGFIIEDIKLQIVGTSYKN